MCRYIWCIVQCQWGCCVFIVALSLCTPFTQSAHYIVCRSILLFFLRLFFCFVGRRLRDVCFFRILKYAESVIHTRPSQAGRQTVSFHRTIHFTFVVLFRCRCRVRCLSLSSLSLGTCVLCLRMLASVFVRVCLCVFVFFCRLYLLRFALFRCMRNYLDMLWESFKSADTFSVVNEREYVCTFSFFFFSFISRLYSTQSFFAVLYTFSIRLSDQKNYEKNTIQSFHLSCEYVELNWTQIFFFIRVWR